MSAVTIMGGIAVTMTSREIAELTDKRHDNVMADIRKMLVELHGEGGLLSFQDTHTNEQNGQSYPIFRLPKRELPDQVLIPQTLPQALRLAADLADQKAKAESALAIAAPKAAALDMISAGEEELTVTQAAKVLGIKRDTLTNWLHTNGWVYRQNGSWVAHSQHIQNGRLRYKEAHYTDQKTEQPCIRPYCHITPKGLAKLALVFGEGKAAA